MSSANATWVFERDAVEVAHEALIRYWPRLIAWLDDDRAALLLRESIHEAAQEWECNGREESYLAHRGRRLDEALALREHPRLRLNTLEQAYLDACVAVRVREWRAAEAVRAARERLRLRICVGLGVALIVAIGLAAIAAVSWHRSNESSLRNLALLALSEQLSGDHERGALLALQAYRDREAQRLPVSVDEVDPALGLLLGTDHFTHILRGHQGGVLGLAFDEAGDRLVSAGDDGTIRLWNLNDPKLPPMTLPAAHHSGANVVAFQPHGSLIASGGDDRVVLLQDPSSQDGDATITLEHGNAVRAIAFDPRRNVLATAGREGCLRIWDLDRIATPVCTVPVEGGAPIRALAFHPTRPQLLSADLAGNISSWDVGDAAISDGEVSGRHIVRHEGPHLPQIWDLVFTPSGDRFVSVGADGTIRLWNSDGPGSSPTILGTYLGFIRSVAFSPDGQLLASGGDDGIVRLWAVDAPGLPPQVLQGHRGGVSAVAFDPAGRWLASAGADGTIRLWELTDPTALLDEDEAVTAIAIDPAGIRIAASVGDKGAIAIRDLTSPGDTLRGVGSHGGKVTALAFDPAGDRLVSGGGDGLVRLWRLNGSTVDAFTLPGKHVERVTDLTFSPDGRWLVSSGVDEKVRIWDTTQLHLPATDATGDRQGVNAVVFEPAGRWLAASGSEGDVALWTDVANLAPDPEHVFAAHEGRANLLRIDPQRRWLVSAGYDGEIKLWSLDRIPVDPAAFPVPDHTLSDHDGAISAIAFSPEGDTLASASSDGKIRLWNLRQPEAGSRVLISNELNISALAFRADGQLIVVSDGDLHLWDTSLQTLAETVCERVGRNLTRAEWERYFGAREYQETCSLQEMKHGVSLAHSESDPAPTTDASYAATGAGSDEDLPSASVT